MTPNPGYSFQRLVPESATPHDEKNWREYLERAADKMGMMFTDEAQSGQAVMIQITDDDRERINKWKVALATYMLRLLLQRWNIAKGKWITRNQYHAIKVGDSVRIGDGSIREVIKPWHRPEGFETVPSVIELNINSADPLDRRYYRLGIKEIIIKTKSA